MTPPQATPGAGSEPATRPASGGGADAGTARRDLEARIARVLMAGTYVSVALIAAGVGAMVLAGISPLDPAPGVTAAGLRDAIVRLRPEGLLGLGLVAVVFTPSLRVAASLVGYVAEREQTMAVVSAAILAVIAASVLLAIGLQG